VVSETQDDILPLSSPEPAGQRHEQGFVVVRRGYDRHQVEDAFAELQDHAIRLDGALDAERGARAQAESEVLGLRADLAAARQAATPQEPTFEVLGERVGQILALARDEAAELRARAEREVAPLRAETAAQTAGALDAAHARAQELVATATAEAERLLAEGRLRRQEAERAAEELSRQAAQDAAAARDGAHAEAQETVRAAGQEAEEALAAASRDSGDLRRAAREEVARLSAQRDDVRADLERLRDALGRAVGLASPVVETRAGKGGEAGEGAADDGGPGGLAATRLRAEAPDA